MKSNQPSLHGAQYGSRTLTSIDKLAVVALTLVLADVSTRLIEDPIRYSRRVVGAPSRVTLGWAAMGMACVVAVAGIGMWTAETARIASLERTAYLEEQAPLCLGAMAVVNAARCEGIIAPSMLVPDPAHASGDTWYRPDCWAGAADGGLRVCTLGARDAPVRLAAIGDSHSNAFLGAYEAIAERNGWRIDVAGHNGCYWTTGVQVKAVQAMVDGCEQWKANLAAYLATNEPYDAILVTHARQGAPLMVGSGTDLGAETIDRLA